VLPPENLVSKEEEIGQIKVQGQPRQKFSRPPSQSRKDTSDIQEVSEAIWGINLRLYPLK
jgi:hypothetical protein